MLLLCGVLFAQKGYAQESRVIYSMALEEARAGNTDSAFMHFNSLLMRFPDTKYSESALFATAEYFFSIGDYFDASERFVKLVSGFFESKSRPFALCYLLKLAKMAKEESLVKNLEKEIFTSQQFSFVFRDHKEIKYTSSFGTHYKVAYYIDKVEFYIDGELFEKIHY
jgi:outer membrane protein assembly factor BamD (BamD/ComL family)